MLSVCSFGSAQDGVCGRIRKVECGELAVVFPCPSIISSGGADFVVEVAEVVGSVIAPYRGSPFEGH